jgi:hypothetical protein
MLKFRLAPGLPPTLKDDTRESLHDLNENYRSARGVVPFVGAGISRQFGLPTWTEFLMIQAREMERPRLARIKQLLKKGKFEEAADRLAKGRLNAFKNTLKLQFGDRKLEDHTKRHPALVRSTAAALIPFITKGPVITTNFDHVLEKAFENRGRKFEQILLPQQQEFAAEAFQNNRTCLLKLHGDVNDPGNQIITRTDYQKKYVAQKDLPKFLARTFKETPLLFIGCSLQDDRTFKILQSKIESPSYTHHFAIVEAPASPQEQRGKRDALRKCSINPIWYPHRKHSWVARYLRQIVKSRLALDLIYGPERKVAIVYSHLTLAPEIKTYIEERKPSKQTLVQAGAIANATSTAQNELQAQQREEERLTSLMTYFLVPGKKDGTCKDETPGQQKCRGTKVACVCEARAASYLSSAFARFDYLADPLRASILNWHELQLEPHDSCVYLGIISNPPAWAILKENPLVTMEGLVPDAPSKLYFALTNPKTPLHIDRGDKDNEGNRLIDYGIILRLYSPDVCPSRQIVCAGLGEFATSGAAYFLANNFEQIALSSSETHFVCLIQVKGEADKNPTLVGPPFQAQYGKAPGSDLLAWRHKIFERSKRIV